LSFVKGMIKNMIKERIIRIIITFIFSLGIIGIIILLNTKFNIHLPVYITSVLPILFFVLFNNYLSKKKKPKKVRP